MTDASAITPLKAALASLHRQDMDAYIYTHPESFDELMALATTNDQPYSWRAAWALSNCMDKDDARVRPYVSDILRAMKSVPVSQQRDLARVIWKMPLDEEQEGIALSLCIDIWCRITNIPSARWNALRVVLQIAKKYPELMEEVRLITQEQYMETLSPGIRRSIEKKLMQLAT